MSDPELLTLAGAVVAVVIIVGTLIITAALNAAPIPPRPRYTPPAPPWEWDITPDLADVEWPLP